MDTNADTFSIVNSYAITVADSEPNRNANWNSDGHSVSVSYVYTDAEPDAVTEPHHDPDIDSGFD